MRRDLTAAALADLRAIRLYTREQWGRRQENLHLDGMWARCEEILAAPEKFRHRRDLLPGCQIAAQGNPIILFRVGPDPLHVVRVLHGAMDFGRHLPKER